MDPDLEQARDQALGGKPRAHEVAAMIDALEDRLRTYIRERDAATTDETRKLWSLKVQQTGEQIRLLREEQAITEFVENSVRFTVARSRIDEQG